MVWPKPKDKGLRHAGAGEAEVKAEVVCFAAALLAFATPGLRRLYNAAAGAYGLGLVMHLLLDLHRRILQAHLVQILMEHLELLHPVLQVFLGIRPQVAQLFGE